MRTSEIIKKEPENLIKEEKQEELLKLALYNKDILSSHPLNVNHTLNRTRDSKTGRGGPGPAGEFHGPLETHARSRPARAGSGCP